MISAKEISEIIGGKIVFDSFFTNQLICDNKYVGKCIGNNICVYIKQMGMSIKFTKNLEKFERKNITIYFYLSSYNSFDVKCFVLDNMINVLEIDKIVSEDNINSIIFNTIDFYEMYIHTLNKYPRLNSIYTYQKRKNILKEFL